MYDKYYLGDFLKAARWLDKDRLTGYFDCFDVVGSLPVGNRLNAIEVISEVVENNMDEDVSMESLRRHIKLVGEVAAVDSSYRQYSARRLSNPRSCEEKGYGSQSAAKLAIELGVSAAEVALVAPHIIQVTGDPSKIEAMKTLYRKKVIYLIIKNN